MSQNRRVLEGEVVSTKMRKTIVVRVERIKVHPLYKKRTKKHKKFKAHDEKEAASPGDIVRIRESRPYSKEKRFELIEIVKKASEK
ncbi:MAG TPA: 30S ribosomal protein S17 [Candidatus Omnitrophica bacterium]|nr:MAG: 30S ribosomal protein S17 [Candidatus Omnitrophota bacterium]RKY42725.1 MAG: 30S ribosomal protein S17 [Candidatus Omnitrophota bacterium]HEC69086.1 30S ribosomal protein S17 [Candidatus Omnitrophota bacterium]